MIYSLEKESMARFISLYKEIDCLKVHDNCCLLSERRWNFNIPGLTFLSMDAAYTRAFTVYEILSRN